MRPAKRSEPGFLGDLELRRLEPFTEEGLDLGPLHGPRRPPAEHLRQVVALAGSNGTDHTADIRRPHRLFELRHQADAVDPSQVAALDAVHILGELGREAPKIFAPPGPVRQLGHLPFNPGGRGRVRVGPNREQDVQDV